MDEPSQEKSWEDVLTICNSLILFKNRADANGWRDAFENMSIYLQRVGLEEDINRMSFLHVAGTKGKGSTSAMLESILRQCGYRTGLFTSPHLVDVRERIRINGELVSKETFESHFWDCYNRLNAAATPEVGVPGYFRFMTLLALRIFAAKNPDVVVMEVGIGGRLDATNVIPPPVACGITSLGFDHMEMLGDTLEKIATEKAGILKPGSPGFTLPQPDEAMMALQRCATNVPTSLEVVPTLAEMRTTSGEVPKVALGGDHQMLNAGMAVKLATTWEANRLKKIESSDPKGAATIKQRLELLQQGIVPPDYERGLKQVSWPGRSQVIHDPEFEIELPAAQPRSSASCSSSSSSSSSNSGNLASSVGGGNSASNVLAGSSRYSSLVSSVVDPEMGSRLTYFIDGAHSPESMDACAEWFAGASKEQIAGMEPSTLRRILLFNCMKERDPNILLPALAISLAVREMSVSDAFFVPPMSQYGYLAPAGHGGQQKPPDLIWQHEMRHVWKAKCLPIMIKKVKAPPPRIELPGMGSVLPELVPMKSPSGRSLSSYDSFQGAVLPSLSNTIDYFKHAARTSPQLRMHVLVTGSLYIVGDLIRLLGKAPK